jgi:DNA-binding HxlR family transcriptional regulator
MSSGVAIPLEFIPEREPDSGLLDALALISFGRHAVVLHAIACGAAFMPSIRKATNFNLGEDSVVSVLKELLACGAVVRAVHSGPPLRVEYGLTDSGRALDDLVIAARAWTERWT